MKQDNLSRYRRSVAISYVFMFLTLFTVISGIFAYLFARKVSQAVDTEVWLQAQALWVMRNILIYFIITAFAALWFIPLFFFYWDSYLWVTGCTVAGVSFALIGFLFLLNAWIKGVAKFFQNKAVF
ncbi:hypothetical protein CDG60_01030 [Acinetobacter chinensis]|jgi:hypothetical protein|uniref:Uncharacterized protein n=1 Tax=Acinetobacter chinensis TaxID=2004650 RepID=A0A3B7LRB1_9GAMM|nr:MULTISPECIES: hypothetical protein [Acinetobacter]AXY55310.1 hypothetical protein CDG60_01030 [Acinetobacter chinensis]AXY61556.1 hypothetical protein CDG61_17035 [Acinetobacter sp. WCHAc010052]MDV2470220.1 hypothetical protein [Acinetobacter chinensis]WOE41659.1 hypothetical protein QSG87_00415 [Acinetobacter chinensis]